MSNFLVETKNEYTTHLSNILTPLILEGLQSIYKEAVVIAEGKENELLKIFQSCLKRIPKWNTSMIEKETNRIINSSHSYGWLNDLIKATLKANLIVLMYNPTLKIQNKLDPAFYQNIKTIDFIHRVYIECARELWNNPYLLYHHFPPIEIKRNQRDCMNLIKDCIKEALRKLLPVKHVLQFYLGEDIDNNLANDQFEKAMSDAEERNLTKLIKKDLGSDNLLPQDNSKLELEFNNSQRLNTANSTDTPRARSISPKKLPVNNYDKLAQKTNSEEKTIGSKILGIINQNNESDTSSMNSIMSDSSDTKRKLSIKKSSTSSKKSNNSEIIQDFKKALEPNKNESFDDKVKKILEKDLATDSDLETSLNYSQEDNDNKYQEIFSNSIDSTKKEEKKETKQLKDKQKFFNNYLQF
jgi:hypothetical protein